MSRYTCCVCLKKFNSETAFNAHRIGDFRKGTRRCSSVPEMECKGMQVTDKNVWTCGSMSDAAKSHFSIQTEE
jgi:hypothetical protein